MKKIILSMIIIFFTRVVYCQTLDNTTDWQLKSYKSQPKWVKTKIYIQTEKFGEPELNAVIEKFEEFNSFGMLTNENFERINRNINCSSLYSYNPDDYPDILILSQNIQFVYLGNTKCLSKYIWNFVSTVNHGGYETNYECENGKVEKKLKTNYNSTTCNTIYEYDEKNDNVKASDCENIWITKYNSKHRAIQKVKYNTEGNIQNVTRFKYDAFGNLVEKDYYTGKDTLRRGGAKTTKEFYEYDNHNNKIRYQSINFSGNGTSLERDFDYYGKPHYKWYKNEYDGKGNLKKVIENEQYLTSNYAIGENYVLGTIEYKYDDHNNWIEKVCSKDNSIIKREIDYSN